MINIHSEQIYKRGHFFQKLKIPREMAWEGPLMIIGIFRLHILVSRTKITGTNYQVTVQVFVWSGSLGKEIGGVITVNIAKVRQTFFVLSIASEIFKEIEIH